MPKLSLTGYLILAIVALVVALGGSGYLLKRSYTANGALTAQVEVANAATKEANATIADLQEGQRMNAKLISRLSAVKAEDKKVSDRKSVALERAITANPDWGSTPLPKEVQDALVD